MNPRKNPETLDTQTQTTPTPGGMQKSESHLDRASAAGIVLSPLEAPTGGRAEGTDTPDLTVLLNDVRVAAARFADTWASQNAALRRALSPVVHAAREFADRVEVAYAAIQRDAQAREAANGGQKAPDREAETPIVVETGGQTPPGEVVGGLVEVGADAVVHDADGNEVER